MSATAQHGLPAGTRIQSCEILALIGAGRFGLTYMARDTKLGRTLAIKEFFPEGLAARVTDGRSVAPHDNETASYHYGLHRFLDETRTLARFSERNVVQVVDCIEAHGTAYALMEYETGEALDARLARKVPMRENEIREIVLPVLHGLLVLHLDDFLHRDICPRNILIRRDGSPVLLDFGTARHTFAAHVRDLRRAISPDYAAPEQYLTDGKQGPWTDVYAAGATLFHCVLGEAPTPAAERVAALNNHKPDPVSLKLRAIRTGFSAALVNTMAWMLAPMPADRPQSLNDALRALAGRAASPKAAPPGRAAEVIREAPRPAAVPATTTVPVSTSSPATKIGAQLVRDAEERLCRKLGPMARVLVRQAALNAASPEEFCRMLAAELSDASERATFLQALSTSKG